MSHKSPLFDDENYLDRLVKVLQFEKSALERSAPLLKADDFKPSKGIAWSRPRWTVADIILRFYKDHRRAPGKLLRSECLSYAEKLKLGDRQVAEIEQYLTHLKNVPRGPADAVLDKIIPYKEERYRASVLEEMIEQQAAGTLTPELWQKYSQKAFAHTPVFEPVSAATLYNTEYAAPVFAVNNKLPTGLAMLAAKPKIGKTWMALQLAMAMACGYESFLKGRIKTPGAVLYFALEDNERRISERLHLLAPDAEVSNLDRLHILHEWRGDAALEALVQKNKYKLIVIDPFLAMTGERKTQDIVRADYAELQPLRALADKFKTTVVVVHHLRKASGEARDLVIGTTGLTAAVDTLWILENTRDGDKTKRLTITGRDVQERTLNLEMVFSDTQHGWHVVADGPEAAAGGPLQRKILRLLADTGPMFPSAIAAALEEDANKVRVTLHKMRAANVVEKQEGGYAYPRKRR